MAASPPPSKPVSLTGVFSNFQQLLSEPTRPKLRVTTEYDSDYSEFFHKFSCKLFDNFAKFKFSFQHDSKGEVFDTQCALKTKHLSLHYDIDDELGSTLRANCNVTSALTFNAAHSFKAKQGEIGMVADLAGPAYNLQLSTNVPSICLPRATLKFPNGEVSVGEIDVDEVEKETRKVFTKKVVSMNGILKGKLLNGACTAQYKDHELNFRYSFKDEQVTFTPSITLPSNAISIALKRRFGPSDKLSYIYNFDHDDWNAVYKHTIGKDYKFKAGYDSEVRKLWASFWFGNEATKAKTAPLKMKAQVMVQVPQDDIQSSFVLFRVKKRWDI